MAKPWYRRRALSVFRDVTSLGGGAELEPSIWKALAASKYLIVIVPSKRLPGEHDGMDKKDWVSEDNEPPIAIGENRAPAFSPDGTTIASVASDGIDVGPWAQANRGHRSHSGALSERQRTTETAPRRCHCRSARTTGPSPCFPSSHHRPPVQVGALRQDRVVTCTSGTWETVREHPAR